jgi:NAD(P)-dependent dehydrogenase (short-subunit alcohol dehydrogenase family)
VAGHPPGLNMADMTGRICVITGATRGIGRATAEGLVRLGASVVLICRRQQDGEEVSRELTPSGVPPEVVVADLSSQSSIRSAAEQIRSRWPRLQVLINNAGVFTRRRELTVDGMETQFAVNHLAYFLLTNLLLDQLKAGAPSRIINVSSGAHAGATIEFENLQGERDYHGGEAYARSKLANILFTYELARRLRGTGVTANCLHPGVIATRLLASYMGIPAAGGALARTFGAKPEKGAETILYLASSPEVEGLSGKYFSHGKPVSSSPESYDETTGRRLWEISERLTGIKGAR